MTASRELGSGDVTPDNRAAAHTPEQLYVRFDNGNDWQVCRAIDDGGRYTLVAYDLTEADAHLFAAAPAMLAALQNLVENILAYEQINNLSPNPGRKYCWDATEQAAAAIAKATEPPHD